MTTTAPTSTSTIPSIRGERAHRAAALELDGVVIREDGPGSRAIVGPVSARIESGSVAAVLLGAHEQSVAAMDLLAGRRRADEGEVRIGGIDDRSLGRIDRIRLRRERIGVVDDARLLPASRTVREALGLPFELAGRPLTQHDAAWIDRLVETLGLADSLDLYPHELCEARVLRASLAAALAPRPALLVVRMPGECDRLSHPHRSPTGAPQAIAQSDRDRAALLAIIRALVAEHGLTAIVLTAREQVAALADQVIDVRPQASASTPFGRAEQPAPALRQA